MTIEDAMIKNGRNGYSEPGECGGKMSIRIRHVKYLNNTVEQENCVTRSLSRP
jgi:hypothetical protein